MFNLKSLAQRAGVFATIFGLALLTQIQKDGKFPRTWTDWALDSVAALIGCLPIGQDPTGLKAFGLSALQAVQSWLRAPADKRAQALRDHKADILARAEAAGAKALTRQLVKTPAGLMPLAEALEKGLIAFAPPATETLPDGAPAPDDEHAVARMEGEGGSALPGGPCRRRKPMNLTPTQKQQLLATAVAVAKSQLGVKETSDNWSNIIKQYLAAVGISSPASWCMAFAVWSVKTACTRLGVPFAATTLTVTGYCPTQVDHARALGTLISAADVASGKAKLLPGYLMAEMIPSEGGYHHTGVVVVGPDADGNFTTVEGNTTTTGGSQGYEVATQHRNIHQQASDGSAKYAFIMTC